MTYRAVTELPDWEQLLGQQVRVHRNLRTKLIVVSARSPKGWKVVGATQSLLLESVRFLISRNRHQWIVTNQRRHVCAWAEGTLIRPAARDLTETPIPLGYNPFVSADFYDRSTLEPLRNQCSFLAVVDNEVFVSSDAAIVQSQPFQKLPEGAIWA